MNIVVFRECVEPRIRASKIRATMTKSKPLHIELCKEALRLVQGTDLRQDFLLGLLVKRVLSADLAFLPSDT